MFHKIYTFNFIRKHFDTKLFLRSNYIDTKTNTKNKIYSEVNNNINKLRHNLKINYKQTNEKNWTDFCNFLVIEYNERNTNIDQELKNSKTYNNL